MTLQLNWPGIMAAAKAPEDMRQEKEELFKALDCGADEATNNVSCYPTGSKRQVSSSPKCTVTLMLTTAHRP